MSHQQVVYNAGHVFDIGDGKTRDPAGNKIEPTPLERDLLGKMRAVNPRMNGIDVVAVTPIWSLEEHAHYLVMAYTTSPDAPFDDNFTNLAHAADMFVRSWRDVRRFRVPLVLCHQPAVCWSPVSGAGHCSGNSRVELDA